MIVDQLFFPRFCLGCGWPGVYICINCQKKLKFINQDSCFYCGQASRYGLTHPVCRRDFGVDGAMAILYYNDFLQKIIKNIKYRLAINLWQELALTIKPFWLFKTNYFRKLNLRTPLLFQPVPLHFKRLRERGFNQAFLIAKYFQQFLNLPIDDKLIRIKETRPQAQIKNVKQRRLNLWGAFEIKKGEKITSQKFILVDDLVTSGYTAQEAAKTLKKAGAEKVFVLALAKG